MEQNNKEILEKLNSLHKEQIETLKFESSGNFITRPIKNFFKWITRKLFSWYVEKDIKQNLNYRQFWWKKKEWI